MKRSLICVLFAAWTFCCLRSLTAATPVGAAEVKMPSAVEFPVGLIGEKNATTSDRIAKHLQYISAIEWKIATDLAYAKKDGADIKLMLMACSNDVARFMVGTAPKGSNYQDLASLEGVVKKAITEAQKTKEAMLAKTPKLSMSADADLSAKFDQEREYRSVKALYDGMQKRLPELQEEVLGVLAIWASSGQSDKVRPMLVNSIDSVWRGWCTSCIGDDNNQ